MTAAMVHPTNDVTSLMNSCTNSHVLVQVVPCPLSIFFTKQATTKITDWKCNIVWIPSLLFLTIQLTKKHHEDLKTKFVTTGIRFQKDSEINCAACCVWHHLTYRLVGEAIVTVQRGAFRWGLHDRSQTSSSMLTVVKYCYSDIINLTSESKVSIFFSYVFISFERITYWD